MKTCTQCKKRTNYTRSNYRKRGPNDEWITVIRKDERLCAECSAKRGARTLQQIHDER